MYDLIQIHKQFNIKIEDEVWLTKCCPLSNGKKSMIIIIQLRGLDYEPKTIYEILRRHKQQKLNFN